MSGNMVRYYKKNQGGGMYYMVKHQKEKVKYDIHFPIQWAINDSFFEPLHIEKRKKKKQNAYVGSALCANCIKYGTFRGVFVQYCKNCVKLSNKPGCECYLQELVPEEMIPTEKLCKIIGYGCEKGNCIFKTYLCGVNLLTIGEKSLLSNEI